jgi:hypothetical protein
VVDTECRHGQEVRDVYERILKRLRECVRDRHYVVTLHADEELADEGLSILDVERAILHGHVAGRQRDVETGEWKYLVAGNSRMDDPIMVVVKFGPTGRMILITVFGDEG